MNQSNLQTSSKRILPHSVASSTPVKPHSAPRRSNVAIRVALVDDDESVHQAFCQAAEILAQGWVIESFMAGNPAIEKILRHPPHVVLMDIRMPEISGIDCTRRITAALPALPVVMHTARADFGSLLLSFQAGANGYLIKPVQPAEIVHAISAVLKGEAPLCPKTQQLFVQAFRQSPAIVGPQALLTLHEFPIMVRLLQRESDGEIAQALHISTSTVRAHKANVFRKLDVHSREEACAKFLKFLCADSIQ